MCVSEIEILRESVRDREFERDYVWEIERLRERERER